MSEVPTVTINKTGNVSMT